MKELDHFGKVSGNTEPLKRVQVIRSGQDCVTEEQIGVVGSDEVGHRRRRADDIGVNDALQLCRHRR